MPAPAFGGDTHVSHLDSERRFRSLDEVWNVAVDGGWRTPDEWEAALGWRWRWSSINARIRDLRKRSFGGHKFPGRRRAGHERRGLFEYALTCSCATRELPCPKGAL